MRILIADDHPIFREGLRKVIEREPDFEVVAEATDGATALAALRALRPEVAVLDIDLPQLDGFEVVRTLRREALPTGVVFLTMHNDEEMVNEALDLGVSGYVVKDSAVTDIVASVRAAAAGQHFFSPSIAGYLVQRRARATELAARKPGLNELTPTERRILRLIAENKTSREIATELFISHRTVENHRANICQKLDLRGSHALLKFALEHKSQLQ
ncbi:MAG: response regulator [Pyrinomonadaceae bacterium]